MSARILTPRARAIRYVLIGLTLIVVLGAIPPLPRRRAPWPANWTPGCPELTASWVPHPPLDVPDAPQYTVGQTLAYPVRSVPGAVPYLVDWVSVRDVGEKPLMRYSRPEAEHEPASHSEWLPLSTSQLLGHAGALWTLAMELPADGGQEWIVALDPVTLETRARHPWPDPGTGIPVADRTYHIPSLHHDGKRTLRVLASYYGPFVRGQGSPYGAMTFLFHSDTGTFSDVQQWDPVPAELRFSLHDRTTLVAGKHGQPPERAIDLATGVEIPVPPQPAPPSVPAGYDFDDWRKPHRLSPVPRGHVGFPLHTASLAATSNPWMQLVVDASAPQMCMLGVGKIEQGEGPFWTPSPVDAQRLMRWSMWDTLSSTNRLQQLLENSVEIQGVYLRTGSYANATETPLGGDLTLTLQQTIRRVDFGLRPVEWNRMHDTPAPYRTGKLSPPLALYALDDRTALLLQWIAPTPKRLNDAHGILRIGTLQVDSTEPKWIGYLLPPTALPQSPLRPEFSLFAGPAEWHLVVGFREGDDTYRSPNHVYSVSLPPLATRADRTPRWLDWSFTPP